MADGADASTFYSSPAQMLQAQASYVSALGQWAVSMANAAQTDAKTSIIRLQGVALADAIKQAEIEVANFNRQRHANEALAKDFARWQRDVTALQFGNAASREERIAAWAAYAALMRRIGLEQFTAWQNVLLTDEDRRAENFKWVIGKTHTFDGDEKQFVDVEYHPEPCKAKNLLEFMGWYYGELKEHEVARRYRVVVKFGPPVCTHLARVVSDLAHVYDDRIKQLEEATAKLQAGVYQIVPVSQLLLKCA